MVWFCLLRSRPANNSHLSRNLDYFPNFFFEMCNCLPFLDPLKSYMAFSELKKSTGKTWITNKDFHLKKEIWLARNVEIEKVTWERKFLLSSKRVYVQEEILLISIRNEWKEMNCDKCVKVCEFCSYFLATRFPGSKE